MRSGHRNIKLISPRSAIEDCSTGTVVNGLYRTIIVLNARHIVLC